MRKEVWLSGVCGCGLELAIRILSGSKQADFRNCRMVRGPNRTRGANRPHEAKFVPIISIEGRNKVVTIQSHLAFTMRVHFEVGAQK